MQHTQILPQAQQPVQPLAVHPRKFIVWLFMVSIFMMFAGWTSAFLVARSEGDVLNIELPSLFIISTGLLLFSSLTMHLAKRAAGRDNLQALKLFLSITLVLGAVFLAAQWIGFSRFVEQDIYFVGGTAVQSFMYVLPFMHGLHIIAGLIFVALVLYRAYTFKVHSKSMLSLEMCATFWHFLDILWLYLFLFLTLYA